MSQREKAESNEYNLRFLVEQQAHKIKKFEEKYKTSLVEILERKINLLRGEVKKLKQDNVNKSRKFCYEARQCSWVKHRWQSAVLRDLQCLIHKEQVIGSV